MFFFLVKSYQKYANEAQNNLIPFALVPSLLPSLPLEEQVQTMLRACGT